MIRLSIGFFYRLGGSLHELNRLTVNTKLVDAWVILSTARNDLTALLNADFIAPAIKSARATGDTLNNAFEAFMQRTDFEAELGYMDFFAMQSALNEFDTVIRNALAVADAYFVTEKAGYSTSVLIAQAERCFPLDLGVKVPKAIPDTREAGKCIAFELPTAAGFHALRATEAVLREYWTAVSKGQPHPGNRTIGAYLKAMDKSQIGNAKVKGALKQIKDLHRNPLMHPRDTLSSEEAVSIFGICQSAIQAMLKDIPAPPATGGVNAASLPSP